MDCDTEMQDLRVVFMGMDSVFSAIPLRYLLASGVQVCAVVTPGSPPEASARPLAPHAQPPSIVEQAEAAGAPVIHVKHLHSASVLARLTAVAPDVILVACFSLILPPSLLQAPRLGCFNLHPSLLPGYRGPTPLFWQWRLGEEQTGVTLHRMTPTVDAGEIVAQVGVPLPDGSSGQQADALLAEAGAALMGQTLMRLAQGSLTARPQDEAHSTYFPWPTDSDFKLSAAWSARRAFNFMRGTAAWGYPYRLTGHNTTLWLQSALAFDPKQKLAQPLVRHGREALIQLSPGVLHAVVLW